MRISVRVIQSLLAELTLHSPPPCKSLPLTIQSSVAIILRQPSNPQVLLTQRAGYPTDPNAYNVVFPGGQCDGDENDRQACQRQVKEEVGLDVQNQCEYKGRLPHNFYYMSKRGKSVYITCHVYLMREDHLKFVPILNPSELRDYRWVPIQTLLQSTNYQMVNEMKLGIIERMTGKYKWMQSVKEKVKNVWMPEVNIGMDRNLWGLTLWVWAYCLQMAKSQMEAGGGDQIQGVQIQGDHEKVELQGTTANTTFDIQVLQSLTDFIRRFQIEFSPWFILKYPCIVAIKTWHHQYRVKPFTYSKNPSRNPIKVFIGVMVILLIIYVCFI